MAPEATKSRAAGQLKKEEKKMKMRNQIIILKTWKLVENYSANQGKTCIKNEDKMSKNED